ncbi:hypothetical protein [Streptomyces sp. SJL17-1]|uniref:hypothetical protein n=1 Tax=Streptomyces sp. SJL17-1 TaxID=2967223 RepID=UPI002966CCD0|nr:hypothetical protein [Streptomyces sp. SJL17-1]
MTALMAALLSGLGAAAPDATVLVASLTVSTSGSEERKPNVELDLKRGVEALLHPQ